jgi:carbonic anhydrase
MSGHTETDNTPEFPMPLPRFPLARLGAVILPALLSLPAWANDGHAAPAKPAAPVAPAAEKTERTAAPSALSSDELRRRLEERIAAVRAAQAQTGTSRPRQLAARTQTPLGSEHGSIPEPSPAAAPGAHGGGHAPHWSYAGDGGPAEWAKLRPDFSTCASGKRQSPIDIRGGVKVDLEPIRFDYKPTGFNVIDNGHTVQANLGGGNTIEVGGRRYELVQFHFHRPSEERINGRQYEMVAHLVHKDPEGRLAVVAVLMDQGKQHPMVQLVWNSLPLEKNDEALSPVPIDMSLMLPEDRRYYTYMGSLTTPPCSEGVLWVVLKQPATMSPEQIAVFTKLYPMNARPIQQASGRMIKESN